jgi:hypothetical protein
MFTLVRAADVEVVADQLLEEDPPGDRPVQGHGGGELDLLDRQLPAVVGVLVGAGERLRQPGQPLAGEPVDLLVGQPVADPLDCLGVADRAERVVQGRERDAFLQALLLGVLVPVEVDLAGVREIAAELDMERAEIGVEAVEIPVVDHRLLLVQPRVPLPGCRVLALGGPPHPGLLLGHADEQDALSAVVPGQVLLGDLVLALSLREPEQVQPARVDVMADVGGEPLGHRQHQRRGGEPVAAVLAEELVDPLPVLQPRLPDRQHHPVNAPDLQRHVTGQDLSGSTR